MATMVILVNMLWGDIYATETTRMPPVKHWQSLGYRIETNYAPGASSIAKAHLTEVVAEEWTLERIKEVAESSKGYYARDFSLHLGWNNVRYIIETALLHAQLLDRTLILPTYVYARTCEWSIELCESFATMVNRGEEMNTYQWNKLPKELQMGWKIPLEIMLDIPHLRKYHKVILLKDWLKIHGLDPAIEMGRNGDWWPMLYSRTSPPTSIHTISSWEYDPQGVVRVDDASKLSRIVTDKPSVMPAKLENALGDNVALDWEDARRATDVDRDASDEEFEHMLAQHGWVTTYTFHGPANREFAKSITEPIRQVAPMERVRGFVDEYGNIPHKILYLQGEIHMPRKPGSMRFMTPSARDKMIDIVVHSIRSPDRVRKLAEKVYDRMMEKVGGRMWMAAHMRRGDFVRLGWVTKLGLGPHTKRIKSRLTDGRKILEQIRGSNVLITLPIRDVEPDKDYLILSPPLADDPFFLATDEKDPRIRKWLKRQGAVLIEDLLTPEDRREFGWSILVTDVKGLLEQALLGKSYYFYGHTLSSVAGGAVNLRAGNGADIRTSLLD
ncbi:hypothetical protein FRC03_005673 [Tulasnella sp. 419]|nr:hypothetical protein FRC03_005673 [Tulasnella sp. 419]